MVKLKVDKPVEDPSEDKLGYDSVYAKSVKNILDNNDNIALGLFGDYGCGKTSIVNFLEKKYDNEDNIVLVKSSVWGHKPLEAIKQIFLDVGKEFGNNKKFEKLKSDLFYEKEEVDEEKLEFNKRIVIWSITIYFLLFLFSLHFVPKGFFSEYISGMIGIGTILSMLLLAYFGIDTISKKKKSPPMHLSDFENVLLKILKTLKRKGKSRIVLIVDDLDRCENIKEVISILDKLSIIKKERKYFKFRIQIILPFSLSSYKLEELEKDINSNKENQNLEIEKKDLKEFILIQKNIEKFLDTFIWIQKPTGLELYKMNMDNKNER